MLAFLFPGQGSQKKGMGDSLFDTVPEFRTVEEEADQILGYSLRKICLEDPDGLLQKTQYTQPCLYTVNALKYYEALSRGKRPVMVAGHSLGEYNALLAAGAFDFLTGLRMVQKRGALMSMARDGAMAAIIGLDPQAIRAIIEREGFQGIDIANYNAPSQIVISGISEEVRQILPILDAAGAQASILLPVSAAFHSRLMEDAADEFEEFLGQFDFRRLQLPVIANFTGRPYPDGDPGSVIRWLLVQQICGSVRWIDSIQYLLDRGVNEYEELGPGVVLTRLLQKIKDEKGL